MAQNRLFVKYNSEIAPSLQKELNLSTNMLVPKLEKIVINMGLGSSAVSDKKVVIDAVEELTAIVGQQAVETLARKSNASFKIREAMPIGVKVTLRGQNMYEFLDKLVSVALPRIRDFRGVNHKSFDKSGNYSLGIKEHIIFPEIDFDKVAMVKGMDITFVTSNNTTPEGAYALLREFGMPFKNIKKEQE